MGKSKLINIRADHQTSEKLEKLMKFSPAKYPSRAYIIRLGIEMVFNSEFNK
jgi:hypothetical protein